jgi:dihydropteroate synthase
MTPSAPSSPRRLRCGRFELDLSRPLIMGILNVTPDSFSDGGRFVDPHDAFEHAWSMVHQGADLIDIGGESTRPGAPPVPEGEELRRILPVLEALRDCPVPVSVDTMKPAVMHAAVAAGVSMINDVSALRAEGALQELAGAGVAVCLMHMQGDPRSMQEAPAYAEVTREVSQFLGERVQAALAAGIEADRIVVDPGFGFGKTPAHNMSLLRELGTVCELGYPVLFGASRKSSLARIAPAQLLYASVAAALMAVERGASIVRVHDVPETHAALAVWNEMRSAQA